MSNYLDNLTNKERAELNANNLASGFKKLVKDMEKAEPLPNVINIDITYKSSNRMNVLKILSFVDKIRDLQDAEFMDISVIINLKRDIKTLL